MLFSLLRVIHDQTPRSAAMNMALDEALLQTATVPTFRFYRWDHAAVSFGYFGSVADVESLIDRDVVRRWTGGGIVYHGQDLTYSMVIPASERLSTKSSMAIYQKIHEAVRDVLIAGGIDAELSSNGTTLSERALEDRTSSPTRHAIGACFANPVAADVLVHGRKVAGAAQRRSRLGLLQQGSLQNIVINQEFVGALPNALAKLNEAQCLADSLIDRAAKIAGQKYATDEWLRRR